MSSGCLIWLQRLQPLFFTVAIIALAYQIWLVVRRPPSMRTRGMKTVLAASLALNFVVMGGWLALVIRYQ